MKQDMLVCKNKFS